MSLIEEINNLTLDELIKLKSVIKNKIKWYDSKSLINEFVKKYPILENKIVEMYSSCDIVNYVDVDYYYIKFINGCYIDYSYCPYEEQCNFNNAKPHELDINSNLIEPATYALTINNKNIIKILLNEIKIDTIYVNKFMEFINDFFHSHFCFEDDDSDDDSNDYSDNDSDNDSDNNNDFMGTCSE